VTRWLLLGGALSLAGFGLLLVVLSRTGHVTTDRDASAAALLRRIRESDHV